ASTDKIKRDRIAIVGSPERNPDFNSDLINHNVSGDRMIFVAPGIKTTDAAAKPPKEVTLPGSYAAAVIAGMLSARDPHISLTNKTASVGGLETKFTPAQLEQLVTARVLALEERKGFRVVKGITVDEGAFRQITTRRIVDFAKFGVRSAADPYIGLLNNDRVRKALKGSINGFLAGMVDDEMLISYELDVTATRDEEIRGIARVTMTLRPTFSIDFIKVVMFLG
ncbi:MAG: phage tail sheath C-terminal domain-containing protein, partial [Blastocatellia bacterium]